MRRLAQSFSGFLTGANPGDRIGAFQQGLLKERPNPMLIFDNKYFRSLPRGRAVPRLPSSG